MVARSATVLLALAGAAAAVDLQHMPSKATIAADISRLEHDIRSLSERTSAHDETDRNIALATKGTMGSFDPLEDHFRSKGLTLSFDAPIHTYYRGVIAGKNTDFILTEKRSQYSDYVEFSLETRTHDSSALMGMSRCHPNKDGSTLRCGGSRTLEIISPRGLRVDNQAIFWRYDAMRTIDVDYVVSSGAELVQVYLNEIAKAVERGSGVDAISARWRSAVSGYERSVEQYVKDWDRKKGDKNTDEDKEVLVSLREAIKLQTQSMDKWAKEVIAAVGEVDVDLSRHTFASVEAEVLNQDIRKFGELVAEEKSPELSEEASKLLKSGTKSGGDALAKLMGKMIADHGAATEEDERNLQAAIKSGKMGRAFEGMLFDAVSSSDTLVNSINGGLEFADKAEKTIKRKSDEIVDWAKSLVGLKKKQSAVAKKVPPKSLKPGEAAVVKEMTNAATRKEIEKVVKKEEKLKITNKFRIKPKYDYKEALTSGNIANVLSEIRVGYTLGLSKGKNSAVFDLDIKVDKPLDPAKAKATIVAKVDTAFGLADNAVLRAGVKGRAEVLGLYEGGTVDEVVVSTYVTYDRPANKDTGLGKIHAGFFATATIPMSADANARTTFKQGAEINLRAELAYASADGRLTFKAYGGVTASEGGSSKWNAGAKLEYTIKDNFSVYGGIDVSGGFDSGYGDIGGGRRDNDVRATIGLQWKW